MQNWEKWSYALDDRSPIYRQIILQFNRAIVRGDIEPGDRIPSIRDLSALMRVNTNTIQRVYQELERDGIISSKRGTGYFLTEDMNMTQKIRHELSLESLRRFVDEMRALGLEADEILDELKFYMKGDESNGTGA